MWAFHNHFFSSTIYGFILSWFLLDPKSRYFAALFGKQDLKWAVTEMSNSHIFLCYRHSIIILYCIKYTQWREGVLQNIGPTVIRPIVGVGAIGLMTARPIFCMPNKALFTLIRIQTGIAFNPDQSIRSGSDPYPVPTVISSIAIECTVLSRCYAPFVVTPPPPSSARSYC